MHVILQHSPYTLHNIRAKRRIAVKNLRRWIRSIFGWDELETASQLAKGIATTVLPEQTRPREAVKRD